MTLTEFLSERLTEDEALSLDAGRYGKDAAPHRLSCGLNDINVLPCDCGYPARVLAEVAAKRAIVECHKSWPVLMEGPPTFERVDGDMDSIAFRASQQIQWLTEQEYRARFGDEPPTAPMLRHLAAVYSDHEDYDPSWVVT